MNLKEPEYESIREFIEARRTHEWNPDLLWPLQAKLRSLPPNEQVSVYLALADSVETYEKEKGQPAPAREAMLLQALLPLSASPSVRAILGVQVKNLSSRVTARLLGLLEELRHEPRHLLRGRGGLAEIYYLPIRLSLLLGWIGTTLLARSSQSERDSLRDLTQLLIREYGNSLVAVDDRQAPGIFTFVVAAMRFGWQAEFEEVLTRLFVDLVRTSARVARSQSEAGEKLTYLLNRYNPAAQLGKVTQKPSELLASIVSLGAICGMDRQWDKYLYNIDHAVMNSFFFSDPISFDDEKISRGNNVTLEIGEQFSTLAELRMLIKAEESEEGTSEWLSDVALDAVSLILPNRVNWPRLFSMIKRHEIAVYRRTLKIFVEDPATGLHDIVYDSEESS